MSGLYAFADQLLMVNLIPKLSSSQHMFAADQNAYNYFKEHYDGWIANNIHVSWCDPATVVRAAVAYSAPILVIVNAAALLIGNGVSINYTRYNGQKRYDEARRAWTLGFWSNLIFAILISLIIIVSTESIIHLEQGNSLQKSLDQIKNQVSDQDFNCIKAVYQIAFDKTFEFDKLFIYIVGAGATFAVFTQFFALLVISEGKQAFIVIVAVICNAFNILLDFLLIKYAQLAMLGGAIALVFGWALNALIYFVYIWYLGNKGVINLHIKYLKHLNWSGLNMWSIFSLGLPSFLRNLSMALAATIQLWLLAKVTAHTGGGYSNSEYQDIYGAINPIYNLFYTAEVGIINGARITCAYNYGAKNYKRVRQSYWILNGLGALYGLITFVIIYFTLSGPLLSLFNITKNANPTKFQHAQLMLLIAMLQMPIFSIGIGGMMLFQATNRWWQASLCGIMQGLICAVPISFLMQWAAITHQNINLFLWNPFLILCITVIIVFVWSVSYMYKNFVKNNEQIS